MIKIIKSLFKHSDEKGSSEKPPENESEEKKKCQKCLRRVGIEFEKCPFCKGSDFSW